MRPAERMPRRTSVECQRRIGSPRNTGRWLTRWRKWFRQNSPFESSYLCTSWGATRPPRTDFPGCWLTARSQLTAPMFRRTCVSVRLSVSSRCGWRPKPQPVPHLFLARFSASLAAFSELVNTTVVLAARARQSSTNGCEVIHSQRFLRRSEFCVRLGPTPKYGGTPSTSSRI